MIIKRRKKRRVWGWGYTCSFPLHSIPFIKYTSVHGWNTPTVRDSIEIFRSKSFPVMYPAIS